MRRVSILAGAMLLIAVTLTQCGIIVSSAPFSATVVNSNSNLPIEGVVVLAKWDLLGIEGVVENTIAIAETVTDADGAFSVPGWGPRVNRKFLYSSVRDSSPEVIVYKLGFEPESIYDYRAFSFLGFHMRAAGIDGSTISLSPSDGPILEHSLLVNDVEVRISSISRLLSDDECSWKRMPHLLVEMHRAGEAAMSEGADARNLLVSRIPKKDCGDPIDFFLDYLE